MFEWDEIKNKTNVEKHSVTFDMAAEAFNDPCRLTLIDENHSDTENRYYCIGKAGAGIMTVRFVPRNGKIRIIGAGYWRKGKKIYEGRTSKWRK
jgi:uncharacterized DUF497 family protein